MHVKRFVPVAAICLAALAPLAHAGRSLSPQDWYRFQAVTGLALANDGSAAVYVVTSYDKAADESRDAIWSVDWNAGHPTRVVQLKSEDYAPSPHFTPDGRSITFLSAQTKPGTTQLWLVGRAGGSPRQLSHVPGDVRQYAWAPDGRHAVLAVSGAESKTPRPIVIDALHFKEDREGYLDANSRTHLYLLDAVSGRAEALASDPLRSDSLAIFSNDAKQLAFVGKRDDAADDLGADVIYVADATAHATPRRVARVWAPNHQQLIWSEDGQHLILLLGNEPKYNAYITDHLAVLDTSSGRIQAIDGQPDRAALVPCLANDRRTLQFALEDDGYQYPAQLPVAGGTLQRLAGPSVVEELACAGSHTAVLATNDSSAVEVYALEQGKLRPLSAHNQALLAELSLGSVSDLSFRASDGTDVHGQIVKPPGYVAGRRYPTIVWIHGGPNGQDDHSLELEGYSPPLERQLFATHGFVVLAINYRGSTGRGVQYARSIAADWGDKEVIDLRAGLDYAIATGIADPARLGVGGWSYGGILTDCLIASDPRFKAAISGAGSANQLSMYGADEYILQYNAEMGVPWRTTDRWLKVSYAFFHADRIKTPTLFMGGDKDFDVPLAGGEQMYQALRSLGVPSELIVYPGEYHVLTRPSFLVDRFQRYLDWMTKYLGQP